MSAGRRAGPTTRRRRRARSGSRRLLPARRTPATERRTAAGTRAGCGRDGAAGRAPPRGGTLPLARYPLRNWSSCVRQHPCHRLGRVGSAVAARLGERGVAVSPDAADLIILCVPDAAIAEVARSLEPGPWIAHVSGATPLAALDPHERRFSVHPLQTFTRARGAEQLDGAWAAVTAETAEARARTASGSRETLGLRAVRARRLGAHALPRRRGDRLELPRHAVPRGVAACSRRPARRRRRSCR